MPPRLGLRPALGPTPPQANANGPYTCVEGGSILASRFGSSDPYGELNEYWTPGDTGVELGPYVGALGDIAITFATAGTYPLQLRVVSQSTGLEDLATTYVVVTSVAAVASVRIEPPMATGAPGNMVVLTATAYDGGDQPLVGRIITWSDDAPTVVQRSADTGSSIAITLLLGGLATVTATCEGNDGTCAVTVTSTVAVGSLVVDPVSAGGLIGDVVTLTAYVYAGGIIPTVTTSRLYLDHTALTIGTIPAWSGAWTAGLPLTEMPESRLALRFTRAAILEGSTNPGWTSAGWASGNCFGVLRCFSPSLFGAGTLSGTIKGRMRCREDDAAANANLALVVRVVSNDGSADRGTALALTAGTATGGTNPEMVVAADTTAAVNRELPYGGPATLTNVAYQDGDRIMLELGVKFMTTTASKFGRLVTTAGASGDLPEDTTNTTALAAWVEFSQSLEFYA